MTICKDDSTFCIFLHKVHVVGDQDNRESLLTQRKQKLHDFRVMAVILAGSRFIQNNHLRIKAENGRNGQPFLLSITERRDGPIAERPKAADPKRFFGATANLILRHSPGPEAEGNFVSDQGLRKHQVRILHDVSDVIGPLFDTELHQVFTVEEQLSLLLLFKTADDFGKSRFSSPVFAHNGHQLTLMQLEGNATQRRKAIVIMKVNVLSLEKQRTTGNHFSERRLFKPGLQFLFFLCFQP